MLYCLGNPICNGQSERRDIRAITNGLEIGKVSLPGGEAGTSVRLILELCIFATNELAGASS